MSLQKYHNSNEHYGDALAQLILSSPEERDAAKRELLQRGRELSRAAIDLNVELRHPEYMIPENQKPEATNPDAQSGLSSASLLDGLSVRAKSYVMLKATWNEISLEEVKARILDGRINPRRHRNNGAKIIAELSSWAGIPTCCPMCKQPWPSNARAEARRTKDERTNNECSR